MVLSLFGTHAPALDFLSLTEETSRIKNVASAVVIGSVTSADLAEVLPVPPEIEETGLKRAAAVSDDIPFVPRGTATFEDVDLRLILAQLAIHGGANGQLALYQAQGNQETSVLLIRGGHVTLKDLAKSGALEEGEFGFVSKRPIVIWSDAGLKLEPGDHLTMATENGVFLLSFGPLTVDGATIVATDTPNQQAPEFRPFVTAAGTGSLNFDGATIDGLGFGTLPIFSGVAAISGGLLRAGAPSHIKNSTIRNTVSVAMVRVLRGTILDNRLEAAGGPAIQIIGGAEIRANGNEILNTKGRQSIRVTAQASEVSVEENVIVGGTAGVGIFVDGGSAFVTISGNLVTGGRGSGISIARAACTDILSNTVALNRKKGISVRGSYAARLISNRVLKNGSSGIAISQQPVGVTAQVHDNVIAGNRSGLQGLQAATLEVSGNDMKGQMPRLLTGDLSGHTTAFIQGAAHEGADITISMPVAPMPNANARLLRATGFKRCLETRAQ